jgi:copper chaperone CopZ
MVLQTAYATHLLVPYEEMNDGAWFPDGRSVACAHQAGYEKVPGVMDARVDYNHKTAIVKYDPDKTSAQALVKATTNAGFPSTLHNGAQK